MEASTSFPLSRRPECKTTSSPRKTSSSLGSTIEKDLAAFTKLALRVRIDCTSDSIPKIGTFPASQCPTSPRGWAMSKRRFDPSIVLGWSRKLRAPRKAWSLIRRKAGARHQSTRNCKPCWRSAAKDESPAFHRCAAALTSAIRSSQEYVSSWRRFSFNCATRASKSVTRGKAPKSIDSAASKPAVEPIVPSKRSRTSLSLDCDTAGYPIDRETEPGSTSGLDVTTFSPVTSPQPRGSALRALPRT